MAFFVTGVFLTLENQGISSSPLQPIQNIFGQNSLNLNIWFPNLVNASDGELSPNNLILFGGLLVYQVLFVRYLSALLFLKNRSIKLFKFALIFFLILVILFSFSSNKIWIDMILYTSINMTVLFFYMFSQNSIIATKYFFLSLKTVFFATPIISTIYALFDKSTTNSMAIFGSSTAFLITGVTTILYMNELYKTTKQKAYITADEPLQDIEILNKKNLNQTDLKNQIKSFSQEIKNFPPEILASGSTVFAINAPWGGGKSSFIQITKEEILQTKKGS